jgi:predicted esterase
LQQLWEPSDAITTIYVHGNRIDSDWARQHGWMVYRQLANGARPDERIRFVIWSWPSDRVIGPIRDARIKAERANSEGYLLGWFLGHFPAENRLSLIGFSYGARVIGGGLHVAGGGTLDGLALPLPIQHREVHASLIAAAMHRDGLSNHGLFRSAQQQIGEILIFFNTEDPILRRYFWLEKSNRQEALGFAGFRPRPLAPVINQLNVANIVGRSHDIQRYFSQERVVTMLRENSLWRN